MYTRRPVTDKCINCVLCKIIDEQKTRTTNNRATHLSNKMFSSNNQKSIIMQSRRVINS